ncbi:class I SAM-dependent methyltransferase [Companilactobacillus versmoldensis]|uniref:Adenine-specific DNA methyltransferase n=1 Tax=Companilactobacillus versmoldensis DSM 14857 = KCTC 3814 TaxID=1423815 RepID=A0A0R1SEG5_9LACO|nr:class I SAM-dependent methyltransferase [Companilactobacillus versmoldensis]KRL67623.1 adenine-specific DNA methyltransferase [Companilactobacillus versmoldensis DSM 14857 = KCTC 3814]
MAEDNELQNYFDLLSNASKILKQALSSTYVDALAETLTNLADGKVYVENGAPDQETVTKLDKLYEQIKAIKLSEVQHKQAITVNIIQAQRLDNAEVNKLMTPDTIGLLSSLVAFEIFKAMKVKNINMIDPTIGTGNLLIEFIEQMNLAGDFDINAAGIDNDETLIGLAKAFSEVMNLNLDAYHQDAIAEWDVTDINLALADLPVGYYPVDDNAAKFKTKAEEGHSYAHHLLIEQTMNNLNDGGIGMFIVPSAIFQTDQAKKLSEWMVSNVYLQAVLDLPSNLFASKEAQKAIVVLQKHGGTAQQAGNVLMGTIPETENVKDFENFRNQVQDWAKTNFKG